MTREALHDYTVSRVAGKCGGHRKISGDATSCRRRPQGKGGTQWAGQPVTLRFDDNLMHVIHDGVVVKTLPSPIPAAQCHRVPGARAASPELPHAAVGPISVQRRVPVGGVVMVTRQRLRIGNSHAGKTVTI